MNDLFASGISYKTRQADRGPRGGHHRTSHPLGLVIGQAASRTDAGILRTELLRAGLPAQAITFESLEIDAARAALALTRPGDALVLPIHGPAALVEVRAPLDGLEAAA